MKKRGIYMFHVSDFQEKWRRTRRIAACLSIVLCLSACGIAGKQEPQPAIPGWESQSGMGEDVPQFGTAGQGAQSGTEENMPQPGAAGQGTQSGTADNESQSKATDGGSQSEKPGHGTGSGNGGNEKTGEDSAVGSGDIKGGRQSDGNPTYGGKGENSREHISGEGEPYIWNRLGFEAVKLPEAYDYRKAGRAPRIGNQGSLGTCWAFASLTALESSLLPERRFTFAVDHMSMHNSFLLGQDEGGEYTMSMAYLLSWQGPVLESQDPYGDGISPDNLKPSVHVQEIQILPPKDYEAIKRAVYLNGGVQSSLYTSMKNYQSESIYYNRNTNSYCYIGNQKPNHDSVIVGWDDNYPKENFNMALEGDGAFICTNSWGEDFGEQGYFYVSYYDANIGVNNIAYTGVEPADNYARIYQGDLCGWVGQIGYGEDQIWAAAAYRAGSGEMLSAAGFYATGGDTEYEIYVARHLPEAGLDMEAALNNKKLAVKGTLSNAGYYTVPFEDKILLDDNEKFAIIMKIRTPGTVHPAAIEYDAGDGIAKVELADGESYLSHDGKTWEHVEETQQCNVCLKAYTTMAPVR